jgi:hypothetical protein
MADWTDGIQKNYCFLAKRECAYCNSLGQCELTGYCYYRKPTFTKTSSSDAWTSVKSCDTWGLIHQLPQINCKEDKAELPETLVINGITYVRKGKE